MDSEESTKSNGLKTNKEEIWEIINRIHKNNLEKVRQENIKSKNKRKRKLSESSIDELVEKVVREASPELQNEHSANDPGAAEYSRWRDTEYDTYNSVSRRSVIQSIDIMEKVLSTKKKNNLLCLPSDYTKSYETLWASTPYITKYVRSCVLRHDWNSLNYLLLFLLKYNSFYTCYIKQVRVLFIKIISLFNLCIF